MPAGTPPLARIALLYRGNGLSGAVGNAVIPIPTGRCVGGTTTINSGTCYRALDAVLREVGARVRARRTARGGSRPATTASSTALGVGPVPEPLLGNGERRAAAACARLGWRPAAIRRNAAGCRGTGVCAFGCPRDAKQAMHVSYVPRALDAGATLVTGARAERVETERGAATGVTATLVDDAGGRTGRQLRVRAERVVVAAGALATPGLLARSGLARAVRGRAPPPLHPAVARARALRRARRRVGRRAAGVARARVRGGRDLPPGSVRRRACTRRTSRLRPDAQGAHGGVRPHGLVRRADQRHERGTPCSRATRCSTGCGAPTSRSSIGAPSRWSRACSSRPGRARSTRACGGTPCCEGRDDLAALEAARCAPPTST